MNPDDPVITIKGFCSDASLTRRCLQDRHHQGPIRKTRRHPATGNVTGHARQLATALRPHAHHVNGAERRELDKTPHFEEATHFARMQILSQELGKALQADSNNVSDQDIQDYYQKNQAQFRAGHVCSPLRSTHQAGRATPVPPMTKKQREEAAASKDAPAVKKSKDPSDPDVSKTATTKAPAKKLSPEEQQKAGEEAMKAEAARLRKRLIADEDPEKLKKPLSRPAVCPALRRPLRWRKSAAPRFRPLTSR